MINVKFTHTLPDKEFIWAEPCNKEAAPSLLPLDVKDLLRRKPHGQIVEVFSGKNRLIVARIQEDSVKGREETGSALFKKAAEGSDSTLLLDCRVINIKGIDLLVGILLSSWRFDKYKTTLKSDEKTMIREIIMLCEDPKEMENIFNQKKPAIEGVFLARSLTSEPPNLAYPEAYAQTLKSLEAFGIKVEILYEDQLKMIGMNALLAVGQGSIHSSAVVVLTWNGSKNLNEDPIILVGKGVCFDSGGLCLKPTAHQHEMKWDKAGGGIVAGVMKSVALAEVKCNVIGIIGLVENMPDGAAAKPGDVIKTMSGQTIEIVNTDAEGRLVLADCLWYAQDRYHPKVLIDLGTLTIETFATLGSAYAGLYVNDSKLAWTLKNAGEKSGDLLWELPMGPFFAKQIESSIADIKNVGVDFLGENGAAAEFLQKFVKNVPWAHIDIAGVSWSKEDLPLSSKGVTGFGVRLLYEWITKETG